MVLLKMPKDILKYEDKSRLLQNWSFLILLTLPFSTLGRGIIQLIKALGHFKFE